MCRCCPAGKKFLEPQTKEQRVRKSMAHNKTMTGSCNLQVLIIKKEIPGAANQRAKSGEKHASQQDYDGFINVTVLTIREETPAAACQTEQS